MTELDRREKVITPEQIAKAADTLFQIERRYIRQELVDKLGLAATLTLRAAGRGAVRAVCGSALESLDAQFWASDEEIRIARRLTVNYVKGGWIPLEDFREFGLGTHIPYLAEDRYEAFPQLIEGAISRLFSHTSSLVLEELSALDKNIHFALIMLNPSDSGKPQPTIINFKKV